ncbi:MAG: hypothetical protein KJO79_10795 [Verrucomicrobiae bacterium]|nr:hypothetical protein [Verrucomicrobiae bacterium]NNJ87661.1 hypothetical protein [Akkermansiaceae bacterium]
MGSTNSLERQLPDVEHLFRKMMEKTGAECLVITCQMADAARELVWSGISKDLPESERRQTFLKRFYGISKVA